MRTFFAWTLRVTIWPLNSLPVFLKVPMVAIVVLLDLCFEPAPCGLDGDRLAGGDRRRTCLQAEAQRRMAARRLCCFARNGSSPGEESRSAPLRHRRSR